MGVKIHFSDLFRPSGTVDRATYVIVGLVGFAAKHNIDRIVATQLFHRPWSVFNYWVPLRSAVRITDLAQGQAVFLGTLILIALPFIWVGVTMTLKRLHSAGLPTSLVVLFFLPFFNLIFFLALSVWPERDTRDAAPRNPSPALLRLIPASPWGSAAFSFLITAPLGFVLVLLATRFLVTYGWGLFVALPFAMGLTAGLVYGVHGPRSLPGCVVVACLSNAILALGLLALAWEGIICLAMAAPIAIALATIGGICAYLIQRWRWARTSGPIFASIFLLTVPGVQWLEHATPSPAPVFVVRSSIDVKAPPEQVWKSVVAFSEIPPPTELMFKAGIAYPIRAEILGRGPGAERRCVFSTGAFVEPIEVWDEPRRLKFSVTRNPPPMQEWTPYSRVDPPHLHGYLVSNGGQFLLTSLPNGNTRLEGTTWYRHNLWPAEYWRFWSDSIIHRIHMRVLEHIRYQAEHAAGNAN
jgi:uncharacterized membrane protein YhaH (DUF805 family)